MSRAGALKVALVVVGLVFVALTYPLTAILWQRRHSDYGDAMMLSLYVTLGVFLLLAARNPSRSRSLIAFAAWSSLAHASVMTVMAVRSRGDRDLLLGVAIFAVIGAVLLALAPAKEPGRPASAAAAGALRRSAISD